MTKNILIFADGTGQEGGVRPDQRLSNVYKLFRATRTGPDSPIDPDKQVAFYDPGLGMVSGDGTVKFATWRTVKSIAGLAVGLGFNRNVIDCYEWLLSVYEDGDHIYLFGFSRGAYTARAVANVINLCGIPTTNGSGRPLPRAGRSLRKIAKYAVVKVYGHGAGKSREKFEEERESLARKFRSDYVARGDHNRAAIYPKFIGVFDTVAALGLTWPERLIVYGLGAALLAALASAVGFVVGEMTTVSSTIASAAVISLAVVMAGGFFLRSAVRYSPVDVRIRWWPWHVAMWSAKNYDRFLDNRVPRVRHAMAIDESRSKFPRVAWGGVGDENSPDPTTKKSRLEQIWFAGNHSDIGGSYPEIESRLSDFSLQWIVDEATTDGFEMIVDRSKLHLFPSAKGIQHCEHFAFREAHPWLNKMHLGWSKAQRYIDERAVLHESVIERLAAGSVPQCDVIAPYRPETLRKHVRAGDYFR